MADDHASQPAAAAGVAHPDAPVKAGKWSLAWNTARYNLLAIGKYRLFAVLSAVTIGTPVTACLIFQLVNPDPRWLTIGLAGLLAGSFAAWLLTRNLPGDKRRITGPRWGTWLYLLESAAFLTAIVWLALTLRPVPVIYSADALDDESPVIREIVMCRKTDSPKRGELYLVNLPVYDDKGFVLARLSIDGNGKRTWKFRVDSIFSRSAADDITEMTFDDGERDDPTVWEPAFILTGRAFFSGPSQTEMQELANRAGNIRGK